MDAALFYLSIQIAEYFRLAKTPTVIYGTEASGELANECPSLTSIYYPSPIVWSRHLSLIPYTIQGYYNKLYPKFVWVSEIVELQDGQKITLDWAMSSGPQGETGLTSSLSDTPIVMIHHGVWHLY